MKRRLLASTAIIASLFFIVDARAACTTGATTYPGLTNEISNCVTSQTVANSITPFIMGSVIQDVVNLYGGGIPCQQVAGDPTGNTDTKAAFLAAIAASAALNPNQICVFLGAGTYQFNTSVSYTLAAGATLLVEGLQQDITVLRFASGIGMSFNKSSSKSAFHFFGLSFVTQGVGTANGLTLTDTSANTNPALTSNNDIEGVAFRGADAYGAGNDYWTQDVSINSISNLLFKNDVFAGAATASYVSTGQGVYITGNANNQAVTQTFLSCNFLYEGVGIYLDDYEQGLFVGANNNFTAGTYGVQIGPTNHTRDQIFVEYSQFNVTNAAVYGQGPAASLNVSNNLIIIPTNNAYGLQLTYAGNPIIANNMLQVVSGKTGVTDILITNVTGGSGLIEGNNFTGGATGISLAATASGITVGPDNAFVGVTTPILNSGTGNFVGANIPTGGAVYLGANIVLAASGAYIAHSGADGTQRALWASLGTASIYRDTQGILFENDAGSVIYAGIGVGGLTWGADNTYSVGSTGQSTANVYTYGVDEKSITIAVLLAATCNAAAEGQHYYVKDSVGNLAPAWHATVAGGGAQAVHSSAVCNGTTWVYE